MQRPSVFASQNWAEKLPVAETGVTPFGNGLAREQIGRIRLDAGAVAAYAKAVGESVLSYLESLSDEEAAVEISLPFFKGVYPDVDVVSRAEAIAFFSIGHVSEHLGEVQFIKGLLGMKGAPASAVAPPRCLTSIGSGAGFGGGTLVRPRGRAGHGTSARAMASLAGAAGIALDADHAAIADVISPCEHLVFVLDGLPA
jgi:hypothetical protein